VQVAEYRIVFEQVRERVRAGQIVDGDEVDVPVAERRTHDVPADAAETVNANLHGHREASRQTFHSTIAGPRCMPSTAC
jgi:hypothetical protein